MLNCWTYKKTTLYRLEPEIKFLQNLLLYIDLYIIVNIRQENDTKWFIKFKDQTS